MKKYRSPEMNELVLYCEDTITESSVVNGIVAPSDQQGAQQTQMSDWQSTWS